MGYHVAIVRTEDGTARPLSGSEIVRAIGEDTVFSFHDNSLTRKGDFFLRFSDGELWLQNPTERDLEDMLALAERLKSRVRGDELETYRSATETYAHPDDAESRASAQQQLKAIKAATRKRQWLLNASIIGFFLCLILVFNKLGWLT